MLYDTGRLIEESRPDLGPRQLADQLLEIGQFITRQKGRETQGAPDDTLESINQELRRYYEDLDPVYRPWFEQYLIGSLYPQAKSFRAMREYQQIQQAIRQEEQAADTDRGRVNQLKAKRRQFVSDWYRSSTASGFMTALDVVSPTAVERFGERLNDLVQLTWHSEIDSEAVEQVLMNHPTGGGRALRQLVDGADQVNTKTREPQKIDRLVDRYDQLLEAGERVTLEEDAQQLKERLGRVLERYPQIAENLEAAFSGIVSQGRFLERAPTLRTATKEDLREFLSALEGTANGNLVGTIKQRMEDGLPLRWYHWFMFPKSLDEKLRRYDLNLFMRPGLVLEGIDDDGTVREAFRPVLQPFSHFGAIAEVHKIAARMEDNESGRWEKLVDRRLGWRRQLGDDQVTIERIAYSLREEGAKGEGYAEAARDARRDLEALEAQGKRYEVTLRADEGEEDVTRNLTPRDAVDLMQQRYRELIETA
jgi:hypothetical protein